jgi:NAD(P)H-hydrate epimerase
MRAAEEAAFARGISAEALMEEAGAGIARSITKFFPRPGRCIVFAGKGHNAGDAFVAGRWLARAGWDVEFRLVFPRTQLSALTKKKLGELVASAGPAEKRAALRTGDPAIILDGLLGLGAHPPLREPIRSACREINSLGKRGLQIIAIDLPTGLDGEGGATDEDCVAADFTITVACAKSGLVADGALDLAGRLDLVALPELQPQTIGKAELATPESLGELIPRRKFSSYKNQFGRIGIVAGSLGFIGAAVMCSSGALRAGAGLVELFVLEQVYPMWLRRPRRK